MHLSGFFQCVFSDEQLDDSSEGFHTLIALTGFLSDRNLLMPNRMSLISIRFSTFNTFIGFNCRIKNVMFSEG